MSKISNRKKDKSKKTFEHISTMRCVMKRFYYIVNKITELVDTLELNYNTLSINKLNKTKKLTLKSLFVLKGYIMKSLDEKVKLLDLIQTSERKLID